MKNPELQAYLTLEREADTLYSCVRYAEDMWCALGDPNDVHWRFLSEDIVLEVFEELLDELTLNQKEYEQSMSKLTKALDVLNTLYAD